MSRGRYMYMDRADREYARQARRSGLPPASTLLHKPITGWLEPTPENLAAARTFVLEKWQERARELGRDVPDNLYNACKFASLFAVVVFGGRMRGNEAHQFVVHPEAGVIDLTGEDSEVEVPWRHTHTADWWRGNTSHTVSTTSCIPRVAVWNSEFRERMGRS